jgi:hypothetical protein
VSGAATVRASIAPMHAEPRVSSVQISQRLAGHPVDVLHADGDWMLVRGADGYEGWMHRGYLDLTLQSVAPDERRLSLGCSVCDAAGRRRALPLGAWLGASEQLETGDATAASAMPDVFPRDAARIAATAVDRFAGAPYQWGGVSPWGADCSGIVQTVFWLHGVSLPRDAWQQAELGVDAGRDFRRWMPADLAFFSDRADRRITHVGIALGDAGMVHLALGRGGYAVERFDAGEDPYVAALSSRFVVARRVL